MLLDGRDGISGARSRLGYHWGDIKIEIGPGSEESTVTHSGGSRVDTYAIW